MNTRKLTVLTLAALCLLAAAPQVLAHCQVPCGIYGDQTRVEILREHVTTIEKSMNQIVEEGKQDKPNWNQLVRWVENKEVHADELTEIVTYYFLTQRIKPAKDGDAEGAKKYQHELTLLHHMMLHAMKAKQTTDLAHVEKLRSLIDAFEKSYFGEHTH
ncbi:MAG: superoxide dismutase [Ni] [Acidobacteriota bacterium]